MSFLRWRALAFGVLLCASLVALVGNGAAHRSPPFRAAWLYVGPHNDGGWSEAHDRGRLYAQRHLGGKVETTYKELVPEGPQAAQVIEALIRDGYKLIFATSFGYQRFVARAAARHSDVFFEQKGTNLRLTRNLAGYFGASEDAIFLAGMAAGAATKRGIVGYVASFPIRETIIHTNAFALGVQAVKPSATVRVVWTSSWFDPAKERRAAESLVGVGADVLAQHVDSPAVGQYAGANGIPWVGYDSDASRYAPRSWLTAAVYNWGPYYLRRINAAMDGTWKRASYYGTIRDGFTDIARFGPGVTPRTRAAIAKKRAAIISGRFYEFTGPIHDQKGMLRVPSGKRLTLKELWSIDWLVKGVVGSAKGA
jgi:basic membrane protein A